MRDPESFVTGGSNFDNVFFCFCFLADEGREDPSTTISGPSSARHRNAIGGVPMMDQPLMLAL